ncbi:MAG: EamA family transporter [Clostridiaceae bacterium]|nr:EamA family transporter [Clostridiaceae bacterium]
MWLIFALLTTFSWAFADLFYKKGAVREDNESHIKTIIMVGLVMGIHGFIYMLVKDVAFSPLYLLTYFPVSLMYILSMAIGYFGLRYIQLSISSPIQNSSGAVTSVLIFIFYAHSLSLLEAASIVIITFGIIALAVVEKRSSDSTVILSENSKKYHSGFIAITFPILYCFIDGLGTFADAVYLDELSLIGEDQALLAYEFTFLICAAIAFSFLRLHKKKFCLLEEKDRGTAAVFETAGQFFYVYTMARNAIIAAPLIASYSVFSVLLSRIFLREKLTDKQYMIVSAVMAGIAMLALSEAL